MNEQPGKGRGLLGRLFGRGAAPREEAPEKSEAKPAVVEPRKTPAAPDPSPSAAAVTLEEPPPSAVERRDEAPAEEPSKKGGWFQRLKAGLAKTSSKLTDGITSLFTKRKLDATTLEELEELLIEADLGIDTAMRITEALSKERYEKGIAPEQVRAVLAEEVERVLVPVAKPLDLDRGLKPHIVLVVGVNGTGKTTTIGKLAHAERRRGRKVMMAAGDTFRAAAIEQLKVWGERTGARVVARATGSDAAGLAFEAVSEAKAEGVDLLLIDTAGRLQNKQGLMDELEKIVRVIRKVDPSAPHDVLLVLDATTGQNALNQVDVFKERAGVTGLVMTKLDGTARGGILVAIAGKYGIPVHMIGVGEGIDDLEPFDAREFGRAIAAV